VATGSLIPVAIACIQFSANSSHSFGASCLPNPFTRPDVCAIAVQPWFALGLLALSVVIGGFHALKTWRRLGILENGLLSIHACSISWHAVVAAHHLALQTLEGYTYSRFETWHGYTESLARIANDLKPRIKDIQQWTAESILLLRVPTHPKEDAMSERPIASTAPVSDSQVKSSDSDRVS